MTNIILEEPVEKVSNNVTQFIENNIKLIESNDFNQLYDIAKKQIRVNHLTAVLTEADIEILNYLDDVPDMFLADQYVSAVTIPSNIKYIGSEAFSYTPLKTVDFSNATSLELIGVGAFSTTDLDEVILPSNLVHIDSYAFKNTSLSKIVIPKSVMSIGSFCFKDTDLTQIIYKGTMNDFDYLQTQSIDWNTNSSIQKVFCSDGVVQIDADIR